MTERKLLVGPDPDGSTFARAFSNAARLPTEQDKKEALEQSVAEMRKELHRPQYQSDSVRDARRAPGNGHGWANEVPISAPPGISLIDQMLPAESERRVEARKLLERLLHTAPNDPRVLAAQAAVEKEQKKAGNA